MRKSNLLKYVVILLRIAIASIFILAGSGKFQTDTTMASNFRNWNLGIIVMVVVGVMEITGAILLLVPKTVLFGISILIVIMLGALIIHFLNFEELGYPFLNIGLIAGLLLIIYFENHLGRNKSIKTTVL